MHDPRVGRFFAIDPLTKQYPHYTPYSFSGNKVVAHIELEGMEEIYYLNDIKKYKNYEAALILLEKSGLMAELKKAFSEKNDKTDLYIVPSYTLLTNDGASTGWTQLYNKNTFLKDKEDLILGESTYGAENAIINFVDNNTFKKGKSAILATFSYDRLTKKIENSNGKTTVEPDYELDWAGAASIALTIYHEIYGHGLDFKDLIDDVSTNKEHEKINGVNSSASPGVHELKPFTPMFKAYSRIQNALNSILDEERKKIKKEVNEELAKEREIKKDNTNVKN